MSFTVSESLKNRLSDFSENWRGSLTLWVVTFLGARALGVSKAWTLPAGLEWTFDAAAATIVTAAYGWWLERLAAALSKALLATPSLTPLATLAGKAAEMQSTVGKAETDLQGIKENLAGYIDLVRIPEIKSYLSALSQHKQTTVVKHLVRDHAELLEKGRVLLSVDGYLRLLADLASAYVELVCVNRTVPVYWYAPRFAEKNWVLTYRELIANKPISIRRVTVVDDKEELLHQVRHAVEGFQNNPEGRVHWFLTLLQSLNHEATTDPERAAVEAAVGEAIRACTPEIAPEVERFIETAVTSFPAWLASVAQVSGGHDAAVGTLDRTAKDVASRCDADLTKAICKLFD
ncbi:MAG: hypothetical protein IMZ62_06245, partial [Chloroflexi bacterium]|nr:hypothetical protein [Chloroflexota bacterium]